MNWKVLLAGLLLTVPLLALLASGFGRDPKALPDVMSGRPAPAFSLTTLDGQPVSSAALQGRPVVLNFWATWCQPCKIEHPVLIEATRRYGRDVAFYGVLYQDEPDRARRFLAREGQPFPVLDDPAGRTAIDYGVAGVPETFVISPDGTIVQKFVGPVEPTRFFAALDAVR